MKNPIFKPFTSKSLIAPIWVAGLVGLLVIALWWSGTSTVLAQEAGEGEAEHAEASGDNGIGDSGTRTDEEAHDTQQQGSSDEQTLRCIVEVLGRVPAGPNDITDEEKLAIAERCLGGQSGGVVGNQNMPTAGQLDPQTTQCIFRVLGRVPSGTDNLTDDEKRAISERCFGEHDGGQGGRNDGPTNLNDGDRQCIINVLGRMPEGPDDLTDDEKRLLGQQCFAGQHGGGPGGPQDLDDDTVQCIVSTIGAYAIRSR